MGRSSGEARYRPNIPAERSAPPCFLTLINCGRNAAVVDTAATVPMKALQNETGINIPAFSMHLRVSFCPMKDMAWFDNLWL